MEKPEICWVCKGTKFWYDAKYVRWVCSICHPNPNAGAK